MSGPQQIDAFIKKLDDDSLDAIMECIGAPKLYNDGKTMMRHWFLGRLRDRLPAVMGNGDDGHQCAPRARTPHGSEDPAPNGRSDRDNVVGDALDEAVPLEVRRVAEALQSECRAVFGANWSNDVAWRFARVAIAKAEGR